VPLVALYLIVFGSCICSMVILATCIPAVEDASASSTGMPAHLTQPLDGAIGVAPLLGTSTREESDFGRFRSDVRTIGQWYPTMWAHTVALMVDMYCVSFFSGIMLYLFNDSSYRGHEGQVALFGPNTSTLMPHDAFFAMYNCFTFLGDTLSRQLVYRAPRLLHPFWFLLLSATGAVLCLIKIPIIAPIGIFLIFFANGAIYGTSTKHIDSRVDRRVNLTALSVWLFVGDLGSVAGSNTWPLIAPLVCRGVHAPHMCVNATHG
jgi:hypothetical protein